MCRPVAVFLVSLALAAALACGGKRDEQPARERAPASVATAVPGLEVARAEAERDFGVEALRELARSGPSALRRRAIIGLGRVGGDAASAAIRQQLADASPEIRAAALAALWLAGDRRAAPAVVGAYRGSADAHLRELALVTLGHLGGVDDEPLLVEALAADGAGERAAAALALGLFGRRTLPLTDAAVDALVVAAAGESRELRYGVAYALARQHAPEAHAASARALRTLASDADPEVRSVAIAGLARRKAPASDVFEQALADGDWRVRVQAVRALAGESVPAAARAALADWLVREWRAVRADPARRVSAELHPLLEALTRLRPHVGERAVRDALDAVHADSSPLEGAPPAHQRSVDAVRCLAAAARGRFEEVVSCGEASGAGWPPHLRRMLAAEIADEARLAALLGDADPRVRAAAMTRAFDFDPAPKAALAAMGDALASHHAVEVGALVGGLARRAREHGDAELAVLLDARVRTELAAMTPEAELIVGIFDALAATGVEKWAKTCRKGLSHPNRTIRERARACVSDLVGRETPASAPGSAPPKPPVDPAAVLGQRVVWRLQTSKGAVVVELEPEAAPWHIASIVALARDGFYDGRLWLRVVPDFVVQGGDPTDSGWGGPGYLVPGEPSAPATFERGAVGIADAGLDTGGSQIFIMHSRAPHLEGRYTRVGRVIEGLEAVDALIVGDSIERTTVEVSPR